MAPSVGTARFPGVSHPLSRLGSRESLSVCGSGRSNRDVPPFRDHSDAGIHKNSAGVGHSVSHDQGANPHDKRVGTGEILNVIYEKLYSSNLPSIRKVFRANDPKGEGRVPKEAFSRILWHLYGFLPAQRIQGILKSLDLQKQDYISFDEFVARVRRYFSKGSAANSTSVWLKAVSPLTDNHVRSCVGSNDRVSLPPSTPRSARSARGADKSAPDFSTACLNSLIEKVQNADFDLQRFLPSACFGDGGYVVPAQLRECLRKLNIPATEDDVAKIYRRMEGASPFAVPTEKFMELLGIDSETGRFEAPKLKSPVQASANFKCNPSTNSVHSVADSEREQRRPQTSHACIDMGKQNRTRVNSVARPRTSPAKRKVFDGDILDMITEKLDNDHLSLERTLQAKDVLGKGNITKVDLRLALEEMGIPTRPTDLEHFLARNGLRRKDGFVNYKLLMRRLQSRSNRSLLHKVMRNMDHSFHQGPQVIAQDGTSAPIMEAMLLHTFQREFLELLSSIKMFDPEDTRVLSLDDFRSALQQHYKVTFADDAWAIFLASPFIKLVPPPPRQSGRGGYIAYNDFLANFDVMIRPETADAEDPWLKVKEDEDYSRLFEHKKRYLEGMDANPEDHTLRHDPRPLGELEKVLVHVFLNKFHTMKKEYDLIVREDFRRVDKEKFDYIMFRCGFILAASELSRLWLSMPISRPIESMSFPGLIRHVMKLHYSTAKPGSFNRESRDENIVTYIMEKIRQEVVAHWSILKKKLRFLDPMGTSRIPKEDMLQLIRGLRPNVIDLELHYLVEMLESRVPGKTNYCRLMEFYTKSEMQRTTRQHCDHSQPVLSDTTSVIALRPSPPPIPTRQHDFVYKRKPRPVFVSLRNAPTVPPFKRVTQHDLIKRGPKSYPRRYDEEHAHRWRKEKKDEDIPPTGVEQIYRGNVSNLVRYSSSVPPSNPSSAPPVVEVSANQVPALRRSLRKADVSDRGKLQVNKFRRVLQEYGVNFSDPTDLYNFLRHYDTKLSDQIAYERFLQNLHLYA